MRSALILVELGVLGVATAAIGVLATDRAVRRLFPRLWIVATVALALWLASIALLVAFSSWLLHAVTAATAAVLLAALIRARPGLRYRRRLPPGSMSLVASAKALAHRDFYLERARRHGPVFKMAQYRHRVICIVGLERGHRLLRQRAAELRASPLPFSEEVSGGFLRYMDTDVHRRYAPLFRRALARPVVAAGTATTVAATRRELAQVADDCARDPAASAAPGTFLEPIVFDSFLRVLFGLETGTDRYAEFTSSYRSLREHPIASPLTSEARASLAELRAIVERHSRELRALPITPICSLTELTKLDPSQPDQVCVDNLLFVLRLSTANVVSLSHWLIDVLGRNPEWIERLREQTLQPPDGEVPDPIERVIMESLRTAQSEYLFRTVSEDFEHDGVTFPRGWQVRVCVWESHQDPGVFEQPEAFRPDRFRNRSFSSSEYSPFGWGPHTCNGVGLTTMICRAVLEELVTYDLVITGGAPPQHGARHWNHWQPSSRLRIRLTRRETTSPRDWDLTPAGRPTPTTP